MELVSSCMRGTSYAFVDVADRKIGPGKAKFGKNAANLWKKHMQWAEGPKAFEDGYKYLTQVYANDWRRLAYLKELYDHPERHHFAAVHTYVRARGVDISYIYRYPSTNVVTDVYSDN